MNDLSCIFCKIIRGEIPAEKVYEDDDFLAFLDITPINPGHTLLIPKNHYKNIFKIPDELVSEMAKVIKKLSIKIKDSMRADGINIGMNNEAPAGQVVFHAHIHIMPRFINDLYELWHGKEYADQNEIKIVAKKIKDSLK